MKDYIVRTDYAIPVGYECFVHNLHILKWPTTEADNIGVVEVSVGCKEHPISIKFVIHNFTVYRISALLIIKFVITIGRNRWRGWASPMDINKNR